MNLRLCDYAPGSAVRLYVDARGEPLVVGPGADVGWCAVLSVEPGGVTLMTPVGKRTLPGHTEVPEVRAEWRLDECDPGDTVVVYVTEHGVPSAVATVHGARHFVVQCHTADGDVWIRPQTSPDTWLMPPDTLVVSRAHWPAPPAGPAGPDLSDWRTWRAASVRDGECPSCGAPKPCGYHG